LDRQQAIHHPDGSFERDGMNVGRLEVAARHLGSRFEDVVKPSTSKGDFDADGDCKDLRT
jgi:hypothetical protein